MKNGGNYFLNLPSLMDSISRPFNVRSDGAAGKVFVKMPVRVIVGLNCEKEMQKSGILAGHYTV